MTRITALRLVLYTKHSSVWEWSAGLQGATLSPECLPLLDPTQGEGSQAALVLDRGCDQQGWKQTGPPLEAGVEELFPCRSPASNSYGDPDDCGSSFLVSDLGV